MSRFVMALLVTSPSLVPASSYSYMALSYLACDLFFAEKRVSAMVALYIETSPPPGGCGLPGSKYLFSAKSFAATPSSHNLPSSTYCRSAHLEFRIPVIGRKSTANTTLGVRCRLFAEKTLPVSVRA